MQGCEILENESVYSIAVFGRNIANQLAYCRINTLRGRFAGDDRRYRSLDGLSVAQPDRVWLVE